MDEKETSERIGGYVKLFMYAFFYLSRSDTIARRWKMIDTLNCLNFIRFCKLLSVSLREHLQLVIAINICYLIGSRRWINRGLMTVLLVIVYNGYPIGGKFGVSICLDHTLDTVSLMIHSHLDHFRNFASPPRDGNYYCTRSRAIKTAKQIWSAA